MVDMCTCYRKRNPNFDVVESEVLFGCENVRNISQRVWWWWWWWGGGGQSYKLPGPGTPTMLRMCLSLSVISLSLDLPINALRPSPSHSANVTWSC